MRVLIVNAYKDTGHKAFSFFQQAVYKIFSRQKFFSKSEIKFTTVDNNSIDEYLYEQNSVFTDKQSEKKFDYVDFVFIDGEPDMLPWLPCAYKFLLLLRMCQRAKKVLFAAGCAMLMHVYLCANKYHITRVINGKGRGSAIGKMKDLDENTLRSIEAGDVFLDSGTGDMYCYNNISSEFFPVVNIGFHNHKIAAEMEFPESILKSYRHQVRNFDLLHPVHAGKRSETVCRILKQYVQHWLVKEIGLQDFLISQKNSWDVHAVNVGDFNSHFTVLAESDRSPQIMCQHNMAGVLFNIDQNYSVSSKVLQNFIEHMLEKYQKEQKLDIPLSSIPYIILPCKPSMGNDGPSRPVTASTAKLHTTVYPDSVAKPKNMQKLRPASSHSGFAISKRKVCPVLLQNNATRQEAIQVSPPKVLENPSTLMLTDTRNSFTRIKSNFDKSLSVYNLRQMNGFGNTSSGEAFFDKSEKNLPEPVRTGSAKLQSNYQSELMRIISQEPAEEKYENSPWSKKEIRAMLHGENLANDQSAKKPKIKIIYKSKFSKSLRKNESEKMYTTLNQKNKTLRYPFPGSVTSNEPYIDPCKKSIREEKPNQWITSNGFSSVVKRKSKEAKKREIVYNGDMYYPPSSHKFREEDRSKWIKGSFKVV